MGSPLAGDLAHRDVPTCGLTDRVADLQNHVNLSSWQLCVVVNAERVVLGLLRYDTLVVETVQLAEEVMDPAPRSYRLDGSPQKMLDYMNQHNQDQVLVTTSDGILVGLVTRQDLEQIAH
jgi:CBS domain-containing protein